MIHKLFNLQINLEGPADNSINNEHSTSNFDCSYSIFKVLKDEFGLDLKSFKYFAGHSLEYSALVCANSLTFRTFVFIT